MAGEEVVVDWTEDDVDVENKLYFSKKACTPSESPTNIAVSKTPVRNRKLLEGDAVHAGTEYVGDGPQTS
jgi:hypothetical protein